MTSIASMTRTMAPGSLALDTTVVVLHMRQRSLVVTDRLETTQELYLPATALGELWYGAEHSANPTRARDVLQKFLSKPVIIYPDDETARVYGRLKEHLARAGTPIPDNDLWIAATAHRDALRLYHQDAHFSRLDGLIDHESALNVP